MTHAAPPLASSSRTAAQAGSEEASAHHVAFSVELRRVGSCRGGGCAAGAERAGGYVVRPAAELPGPRFPEPTGTCGTAPAPACPGDGVDGGRWGGTRERPPTAYPRSTATPMSASGGGAGRRMLDALRRAPAMRACRGALAGGMLVGTPRASPRPSRQRRRGGTLAPCQSSPGAE